MGYTLVKSFERGIDTRKLIDTTEAGALLDGRDCHITLGGELEKRAAFVVTGTLPPETIGMFVTEGRVIHTWGDAEDPPVGLPAGVVYHSIPEPEHTAEADDGQPLKRILSVEEFNGDLYVVALYEDDHIVHWWKDDFVKHQPSEGDNPPLTSPGNKPQVMAAFVPTAFGGAPPTDNNVHIIAIWLVSPTTTYNFSGTDPDAFMMIPATGVDSVGRPTNDITVTNGFTTGGVDVASAIQTAVNSFVPTSGPDMSCQADTNKVSFWVEVESALYNGWKVEFRLSFCVPSGPGMKYTLTGGLDPVFGTPPAIPGGPIVKGDFALAHNYRMFATQETFLNFSAPKDPAEWENIALNAGFIDHSMLTSRKPKLISMGDYGGDLAVFGTRHVFIWHIDVLPAGDSKRQTLHGTGTFAPHSVVPYGSSDIMYLDVSGIRSLRTHDIAQVAFAADIGNLIDTLVRAKIATLTDDQKKYNVWGVVEPRSGRLWMVLFDRIYVLSDYPSSRISAWTYYDATEVPVDYMSTSDNSVYWRSGDDIVIYGNEAGDEYDDTEGLARIPYIDGGKPATAKNWSGIDVALFGTWAVRASFDPTVPAALDSIANLTKSTYAQQKIAMNGESPAVSLEFRTTYVGPARIGNAALHYTDGTAD